MKISLRFLDEEAEDKEFWMALQNFREAGWKVYLKFTFGRVEVVIEHLKFIKNGDTRTEKTKSD